MRTKLRTLSKYRRTKILGAVEALQSLLDYCSAVTIPIDEDVVYKYLQDTKKFIVPKKRRRK